jgi:putative PIN family toxin of toxin-antitoxin system
MEDVRAVLDANVVISALIRPDSAPGRIVRAAVDGMAVRWVTSAPLLEELRRALRYPRLKRHLHMGAEEIDAYVLLVEQVADIVRADDHPAPGVCRDPLDEPYLQTALAGRAGAIVTGDDDLLALGRIEDIPILPPAAFERLLQDRR